MWEQTVARAWARMLLGYLCCAIELLQKGKTFVCAYLCCLEYMFQYRTLDLYSYIKNYARASLEFRKTLCSG